MSEEDTKSAHQTLKLPGKLQIGVDDDIALGFYSNFQVVGSNETEFVLDFAYVPPNQMRGKVRSRVIMSPKHAKSLLTLLQQRVGDYENRFGQITLPMRMSAKGGGGGQLPN